MEGQAEISLPPLNPPYVGNRNGTLAYMVFNETRPSVTSWSHTLYDGNNWLQYPDVWVYGNENSGTTNWTVGNGFTKDKIGPEYGFGWALNKVAPKQILLAKFAAGGTSLAHDWRPPSSGGTVGPLWNASIAYWRDLLKPENLTALFPGYTPAMGYEISGFLWVQVCYFACLPPYQHTHT